MAALIKAMPVRGEAVLPQLAKTVTTGTTTVPRPAGAEPALPVSGKGAASSSPPASADSAVPGAPDRSAAQAKPAEAIVRESAEAIRARLEKEHREALSALEDDARREGHDAGFAKGEAAGREKYLQAAETLRKLVETTNAAVADTLAAAEEVVGAIVFEAVCKIVGDKLMTAEGIRAVVAEVVSRAKRDEVISLKVCASDLGRLQAEASSDHVLGTLALEADDSVELGGCIVQLKGGYLDGRIETQFRAFAESIKEAAHGRE